MMVRVVDAPNRYSIKTDCNLTSTATAHIQRSSGCEQRGDFTLLALLAQQQLALSNRKRGLPMPAKPDSKYALKDLHEAIDLFDRKIAYCQTHEKFDSEDARASALHKLVTKRETLVKAALAMASRGVECDAKHLPRSFKLAAETALAAS